MSPETLISCLILGLAGAGAATSNHVQMQMEPVEFQASYWTDFLECIGNVSSLYDVSVSETGWVNIGPIENRDPDLKGMDARLWECVTAANSRLIASVGHNTANPEEVGPVPIDEATHEWLVSGGAKGQEPRPISGDHESRCLRKRASQYTARVSGSARDYTASMAYTSYIGPCQTKSTGFCRFIRELIS